jgi:membrane protease YdiL (CAAX protease family)
VNRPASLEPLAARVASSSRRRFAFLGSAEVAGASSAVIILAELLGAAGWVIQGATLDAALVPILLGHFVGSGRTRFSRLLPILALIALLRVLSVTMAIPRLPIVTWYVTVGGALLMGEIATIRFVDDAWRRLNLAFRRPGLDLGIAALGIPAGFFGYLLLRPPPLVSGGGLLPVLGGIVDLVVFAAFPEELLFRGLLQSVAIDVFRSSRAGLAYAGIMSAIMYLGTGSLPYTVLVGAFGLLLGVAIVRGASVWGATASHSLALVGMAFIWPLLLGPA